MSSTLSYTSREFYVENCPKWDSFFKYNPGARHRRRLILQALETISFKRVLDVGCGNAELLHLLQARFPTTILAGCDISDTVVGLNQKRYPYIQFNVANFEKESLGGVYDLVVCSEVIEHVKDQATFFKNLSDRVAPGGHLLLTCPTGKLFETERRFGHIAHPSVSFIEDCAQQFHLKTVTKKSWGFPLYLATKYIANVSTGFAMKNFAKENYGSTQKIISHIFYWMNFVNFSSSRLGCQLLFLFQKTLVSEKGKNSHE